MQLIEIWEKIENKQLSRNRHFGFFAQPHHYRALKLYRYLKNLSKWIIQAVEKDGIDLSIIHADNNYYEITFNMSALKNRWISYLPQDGFQFIVRDQAVKAAFKRFNISVPER